MRRLRKSIGTGISVLLLLCFSVTVLPMDFLHDHTEQQIVCKDAQSGDACQHKVHVASKKSYCWVCGIHFDNSYLSTDIFERINRLPVANIFSENEVTAYFFECLFSALRGPPQN